MAEVDGKNLGEPGGIVPGGASTTPSGGLDLTDPKDQALARQAMQRWPKRWRGISSERKEKWVAQLVQAGDAASDLVENSPTPEIQLSAIAAMTSVVRTAAAIEGQNQADDHAQEKAERLDAGKPTENINHGVKFIRGVDGEGI